MKDTLVKVGRKVKRAVYDSATDTVRTDPKGKIRKRIEEEVAASGYDVFDIISDLSKRCNILERGLFLLLKDMKDNTTLPVSLTGYGDSIDYYVTEMLAGRYKSRTDLADDISVLHIELMRRDTAVTTILEQEGY